MSAKPVQRAQSESATAQIAGFLAKFDPAMAKKIQACRRAVRKRFPTAFELVYDNYNFLVFGFGPTERPSECIASLTCNAKGVGLCFFYGARLPDPNRILQGSGNQTRFVRLESAATLIQPEIQALLDEAVAYSKKQFPETGRGKTIVRMISPKQRPRRAT